MLCPFCLQKKQMFCVIMSALSLVESSEIFFGLLVLLVEGSAVFVEGGLGVVSAESLLVLL